MAIATIMSLKHGRKKIKFDIELWLFQMTIIFYLFRESGLGLFTELENFYNNFNKVKIIFSIFFIIGMVYSAKIKGNILLKLYFFISLIIMIVFQNIFYIKKIYNKNWIDSIVFLDMIYSLNFIITRMRLNGITQIIDSCRNMDRMFQRLPKSLEASRIKY